ncbi:hypothetical protein DM01DRAFT_1342543 [Hesseltinella vesiculosa]|uniref:Man1/Src1-like C-terminal domain-containing protein n=1 Tax=Hesseltinella vesiculosa TaxID=101127 RepID=A0A1X2GU66_9FUNG|nr:hypothetical protein DM01DRAFT_1342543 [Hesseltinella vesiculosa]
MFVEELLPQRDQLLQDYEAGLAQRIDTSDSSEAPTPTPENDPPASSPIANGHLPPQPQPADPTQTSPSASGPEVIEIIASPAESAASPTFSVDDDDDYTFDSNDIQDEEQVDMLEGRMGFWGAMDDHEVEGLIRDQYQDVSKDEPTLLYYPSLHYYRQMSARFFRARILPNLFILVVVCFSVSTLLTMFYSSRAQLLQNGYCDSAFQQYRLTSDVSFIDPMPKCIPCPDHASCRDGQLMCDPLYLPHRSLTNRLVNLFYPLASTCQKNKLLDQSVTNVEAKILRLLARIQGEAMCRQSWSLRTPSNPDSLVRTDARYIRNAIQSDPPSDNSNIKQLEQEYVVNQAWDLVLNNPNVFVENTNGTIYVSTDKVSYSLGCLSRHYLWKFSTPLIILASTFAGYLYVYCQNQLSKEVSKTVTEVIDHLESLRQDPKNPSGSSVVSLRAKFMDQRHPKIWQQAALQLRSHPKIHRGIITEHGDPVEYYELAA